MNEQFEDNALQKELGIDSAEVAVRKAFLEFTEADAALLKDLHVRLEAGRDSFSTAFYDHLKHFSEIVPLFGDDAKLERLKCTQSAYFSQLTSGEYGSGYIENRLRVGMIYQRVGLSPKWYIGAYRKYMGEIMPIIFQLLDGDTEKCIATYSALLKIILLDMELALDTYFHAEHQAIVREKRYTEQIIAGIPFGLAVVDSQLKVQSVNDALLRMFDLGAAETCTGLTVPRLLGLTDGDMTGELQGVLDHGKMRSGLAFERHDPLGTRYFLADISRAQTEGQQTRLLFMVQDITAYKTAEKRAQYLAQHDALTGLPNRSMIYDRIDYAYTLSRRGEGTVATMLIDLDRFKMINDSLGPSYGDVLLKLVAGRLREGLRESDTVGRVGGNEFVMILLSMTSADDAKVVAKKVLGALVEPFWINGQQVYLTASIGIAVSPADGEDAQELLRNAAAALHQAKKDGRNQFHFFQAEMNRRVQHDMQLESGLHRALENYEFELFYQPQVNLHTGEIIGAEALLRWQHPERGLISPADFIPMLEENGLIVPVGEWVLRAACNQAKAWRDMGMKSCRVAVNLSAIQFHRQDLCGVVQQILGETGLEPEFLELEITESTIMKDVGRAVQMLRGLKSLGVRLSVDDFGTGHSSLNYLKRFATDALKIDQSFVRDIATDPDDALITRTIIDLAHNLKMKVIAEGVETEAQLAFLLNNRCDEMQGYYYSKPLPAGEYTALLTEGRPLNRPEMNSGRTLLLVDDEENILSALKRLLRRDGYRILTATSARQGMELLAAHPVGVIISDQRMPEMCGTDFLSKVKELYPDTVRIVLSGYTELQSITEAINRGAIYKFLTKPWEDDLLRENVRKAFEYFELSSEKDRLTAELLASNRRLEEAKHQLEERVDEKTVEALRNLNILQVSQEILEQLPVGVIGVGEDGLIAVANHVANRIFARDGDGPLQGCFAEERLPGGMLACLDGSPCATSGLECKLADGRRMEFWCYHMGAMSQGRGIVLAFAEKN
ncbi:MAG: EAL domain-containing protein [Gallionella sp.]|nr:MAG: EAL domain-containing protein [Gallionella sp.]